MNKPIGLGPNSRTRWRLGKKKALIDISGISMETRYKLAWLILSTGGFRIISSRKRGRKAKKK